jgi:hypothetical protein
MTPTGLLKYTAALVTLAIWTACAGGSAVAPSNAASDLQYIGRTAFVNGRPVTAARPNLSAVPRYATILPDGHRRSNKRFEYVINSYGSFAGIFDYPKGVNQVGTISDVGGQGCTNVLYGYGKKVIWIVAAYNQITEYRVPQKPLKTLAVLDGSMPSSCAMNTNGDLAVGILFGRSMGDIDIYPNAGGTGTLIATPLESEFFDGYDDKGNLFFDGFAAGSDFQFDEIPKGSNRARTIALPNQVGFPGSVQWDGKYVTVFDQIANKMYQYTIEGTKATLKGTIAFSGSGDCAQTWIATGVVYCGDAFNDDGEVFKYPAGGSPIAVFTGSFAEPLGTVAAER